MRLSLVTVAFDPQTCAFPTEPLAHLDGPIVSVVEHFFEHDGVPTLLLVVHHRDPPEARAPRERARKDPREGLDETERARFDRLRAWRNGRADSDGVPPFVVLTNRQLAALATRRPESRAGLLGVSGIGEGKVGKYGEDLLRVLAHEAGSENEAPSDGGSS